MRRVDLKRFNPEEILQRKWTQPKPLNVTINHNTLCEFCSGMVGTRRSECTLMCIYCNVALHRGCLIYIERSLSSDERRINEIELIRNDSWICFHCIESLHDSKMLFEKELKTAMSYKMMLKSQIIIAKYWRRMRNRKNYTAIYKCILKLQVWFRLLRIRRQYKRRRLEKRRIIKVSIGHVENLPINNNKVLPNSSKADKSISNSVYVIIAVVDQARTQTWCDFSSTQSFTSNSKLNRNPSAQFNSQHLLPGVSASQMITLSVIQKGANRDYFLGQVCVNLQVDYLWMKGGTLNEELAQAQYLVKDKSGQDLKFSYSPSPQGQLTFHLQVFHSMKSECGSMLGSHIEDITRSLNKLPATSAFLHHNSMVAEKPAANSAPTASANLGSAASSLTPSQDIKLPLVQAPDAASMAGNGMKKRLWIAMVEGYLFIYQHYGGPFRLTLNISQFDYSIQPCHQGAVFSLHKFGYPSFQFRTLEMTDYFRWKCALICNFRYVVDPQAEFNTDQLIQDIVKVNAAYMPQKPQHLLLRANSTLSNEQFNHVMKLTDPVSTGVGVAVIKGRAKVNEVRPDKVLATKSHESRSQVNSTPSLSTHKSTVTTSSIEDSVVDLRHSVKLRNKKGKSIGVSARKKRSKVRSVAVLEDQSRSTHIADNIESARVPARRSSLSALEIPDEV